VFYFISTKEKELIVFNYVSEAGGKTLKNIITFFNILFVFAVEIISKIMFDI